MKAYGDDTRHVFEISRMRERRTSQHFPSDTGYVRMDGYLLVNSVDLHKSYRSCLGSQFRVNFSCQK